YQTAYLKANYPVEYMAALLTANSGNQDKVEKYLATCQSMNIKVEPPDINRSQVDFTPVGDRILFGLSAIRNLGQGAIETILAARKEAGGKFVSLGDLCSRVDLRVVNRRSLEALVYCGSFDCFDTNRNQLLHHLEPVISWAQSKAKEKEVGQFNLFDTAGNNGNSNSQGINLEAVPKGKIVEDFSQAEKLKQEKELLGFYISDHPLKVAANATKLMAPVNLNDLAEQSSRKKFSVIAMLTEVKNIVTKNGEPMAFVQMEDITGQIEGIVFPRVYEQVSENLITDKPLIFWGKVQKQDDKIQFIVEDTELVEQVQMVMLELTPKQATDRHEQQKIKGILQQYSGDKDKSKVPVVAVIGSRQQGQFVRLGQEYWVQNYRASVDALNAASIPAYITPLKAN
ncbi:MAG: trans-splicing intein-formed DNA polymerase III subunit alpha C-terminal partner DnaE-C, partial [Okeania sp. SIO2D1]|nr:trans-splicing intein-formed DNA polymerase III subunit alpha C-terminal partner DnaE-C [Okeania sp. SIO2D1]